ncbi:MAG: GtrA family protein [Fibrobacter sp.]|jgi:putative flippase GtrA|nr:GtrA family protein [Fibrobacter sp.]
MIKKSFFPIIKVKIQKSSIVRQFIRYLLTGGLAFVVDFSIFTFLLYSFNLHYLFANMLSLLGGLFLNYFISIKWVFSECKRNLENKQKTELTIFTIIGFIGVGLNQLLMLLMVGVMSWQELFSKIIATALVLFWNFGARKMLLFRFKKDI